MATNNVVNTPLKGSIGTGTFVGSTSPTLVTPTLGVVTGTSLAFSPTTGGIVGTTTNDSVVAGSVGEIISSTIATPGSSISNNTATTITSIVLTAGDWDIWGNVSFILSSATAITVIKTSLSPTTNTLGTDGPNSSLLVVATAYVNNQNNRVDAGMCRVSTTGQTFYLVGLVAFTGTATAFGNIIARRRR